MHTGGRVGAPGRGTLASVQPSSRRWLASSTEKTSRLVFQAKRPQICYDSLCLLLLQQVNGDFFVTATLRDSPPGHVSRSSTWAAGLYRSRTHARRGGP